MLCQPFSKHIHLHLATLIAITIGGLCLGNALFLIQEDIPQNIMAFIYSSIIFFSISIYLNYKENKKSVEPLLDRVVPITLFICLCFTLSLSLTQDQKAFSEEMEMDIRTIFQPKDEHVIRIIIPTTGEPAYIDFNIIKKNKPLEAGDYDCKDKKCEIVFH